MCRVCSLLLNCVWCCCLFSFADVVDVFVGWLLSVVDFADGVFCV